MREFEELKAKLSEDPQSFVAILGAGVSIPAGLPSWSGLRDILCDAIPDVIIDEDDAQRAVDTAKAATDLWHSFSRLRTSLGPFKYEKTIRGALDITEKDIPPLYKQLWKLNISGIIDFNLDKFAINAYSAVNKTAVDFASAREPHITQLHRAWLVDPRSDNTCSVYGYKTLRYIGNGAFGSVFEAEDLDGNRCALKVLLPDVKDKMSYLSCFRRGIRSMKILRDKNIAGMVKIHDSYEIPACIVMDLVDGITLRTAINNRYISALEVKLSILEQIASIIHSAHQLEERILHRDLKPENVMLEECYSAVDFDNSDTPPKVKVLDFDLSWHRGATEKTVIAGAVSQGFMAPEQVDTSVDRSLSRNTAVDVYSIGMLAFYVLTGTNPIPNQALLQGFHSNLLSALCAVQKYN
jgi:hypothetical protein